MSKPTLNKARNKKIYADHLKKVSYRDLAEKYGVSHTRARTIVNEWEERMKKNA